MSALNTHWQDGASQGQSQFTATHWTQVRDSQAGVSAQAEEALARLCQSYWYPLYCFVRRQGQSPPDAEDLVQGFFAKVLEKNYFKNANPEKGRLRSFLLLALKGYMANEWDKAQRQKRGGGQAVISLDLEQTEYRYGSEPIEPLSMEKIFDRQWAISLLDQVLDELEKECCQAGTATIFIELKTFLSGRKANGPIPTLPPNSAFPKEPCAELSSACANVIGKF